MNVQPQFDAPIAKVGQARRFRPGLAAIVISSSLATPALAQSNTSIYSKIVELQNSLSNFASSVATKLASISTSISTLGTKLDTVLGKVEPAATKTLSTPPVYRRAGYGVACDVVNPTAAAVAVTVTMMKNGNQANLSSVVHSGPVAYQLAAGQVTGFLSFVVDNNNLALSEGFYWCKYESTADISGLRGSIGLHPETIGGVTLFALPAR